MQPRRENRKSSMRSTGSKHGSNVLSSQILSPNQHAMDKSQEDRLAEKIEREALDTALSSSSGVERFLLSAASSGSISSQYSDIKNEFSKYSRPRSGKDDDWRGSPTGFPPDLEVGLLQKV